MRPPPGLISALPGNSLNGESRFPSEMGLCAPITLADPLRGFQPLNARTRWVRHLPALRCGICRWEAARRCWCGRSGCGRSAVVICHPVDYHLAHPIPGAEVELLEVVGQGYAPHVVLPYRVPPDLFEEQPVGFGEARAEPVVELLDDLRQRRGRFVGCAGTYRAGTTTCASSSSSSRIAPDETCCSRSYSNSTASPRRTVSRCRSARRYGNKAGPNADSCSSSVSE